MLGYGRVTLRRLGPADADRLYRWFNDPEVMYLAEARLDGAASRADVARMIAESAAARLADYGEGPSDGAPPAGFTRLGVCDETGELIGYAHWECRDRKAGVWSLGIMIGEQSKWGRHYGSDAIRACLDCLFDRAGAHKVRAGVFAYNERGLRAFERCGFVHEGLIRATNLVAGRYVDTVFFGILREEYAALRQGGQGADGGGQAAGAGGQGTGGDG